MPSLPSRFTHTLFPSVPTNLVTSNYTRSAMGTKSNAIFVGFSRLVRVIVIDDVVAF